MNWNDQSPDDNGTSKGVLLNLTGNYKGKTARKLSEAIRRIAGQQGD